MAKRVSETVHSSRCVIRSIQRSRPEVPGYLSCIFCLRKTVCVDTQARLGKTQAHLGSRLCSSLTRSAATSYPHFPLTCTSIFGDAACLLRQLSSQSRVQRGQHLSHVERRVTSITGHELSDRYRGDITTETRWYSTILTYDITPATPAKIETKSLQEPYTQDTGPRVSLNNPRQSCRHRWLLNKMIGHLQAPYQSPLLTEARSLPFNAMDARATRGNMYVGHGQLNADRTTLFRCFIGSASSSSRLRITIIAAHRLLAPTPPLLMVNLPPQSTRSICCTWNGSVSHRRPSIPTSFFAVSEQLPRLSITIPASKVSAPVKPTTSASGVTEADCVWTSAVFCRARYPDDSVLP